MKNPLRRSGSYRGVDRAQGGRFECHIIVIGVLCFAVLGGGMWRRQGVVRLGDCRVLCEHAGHHNVE